MTEKEIDWTQTKKQTEAWKLLSDKKTDQILFGGAAGGGKTVLGVSWLIVQAGKYPETRWLMGRAVNKRLKETTLVTFFDVCKKWGIMAGKEFNYNSIDGRIRFSNGSEILLADLAWMPSDPNYDRFGSLEISGGFIDEISEITFRAWSVVFSRIRYKIEEYGIYPKLLGSCNPNKGWSYKEAYKPWAEGKEADIKFVQSLPGDNPFLPEVYVKNLKKIKDKAIKERLLYGNWEYDDDPSSLFSFDVIQDLFTNKGKGEGKYITADIARKGRDRAVAGYWEGLQLKKIYDIPFETKKDLTKLAEYIRTLSETHQVRMTNVLCDEDGIGGGVVDMLGCSGFINNAKAIQPIEASYDSSRAVNYANLKTQCYLTLASKAEAGEVGISENNPDVVDLIIEELEQIKLKDVGKDGKLALVGKDVIKDNIGRSPDFADMIMMRMFYELKDTEPDMRFL